MNADAYSRLIDAVEALIWAARSTLHDAPQRLVEARGRLMMAADDVAAEADEAAREDEHMRRDVAWVREIALSLAREQGRVAAIEHALSIGWTDAMRMLDDPDATDADIAAAIRAARKVTP